MREGDDADVSVAAVGQVGVVIIAATVGANGVIDVIRDGGVEVLARDPLRGPRVDHVAIVVAGAGEGGDEVAAEEVMREGA